MSLSGITGEDDYSQLGTAQMGFDLEQLPAVEMPFPSSGTPFSLTTDSSAGVNNTTVTSPLSASLPANFGHVTLSKLTRRTEEGGRVKPPPPYPTSPPQKTSNNSALQELLAIRSPGRLPSPNATGYILKRKKGKLEIKNRIEIHRRKSFPITDCPTSIVFGRSPPANFKQWILFFWRGSIHPQIAEFGCNQPITPGSTFQFGSWSVHSRRHHSVGRTEHLAATRASQPALLYQLVGGGSARLGFFHFHRYVQFETSVAQRLRISSIAHLSSI